MHDLWLMMHDSCLIYVWYIPEIYQNIPEISLVYHLYMPRIYSKYTQNIPEINLYIPKIYLCISEIYQRYN